jgi:hypothetical protein
MIWIFYELSPMSFTLRAFTREDLGTICQSWMSDMKNLIERPLKCYTCWRPSGTSIRCGGPYDVISYLEQYQGRLLKGMLKAHCNSCRISYVRRSDCSEPHPLITISLSSRNACYSPIVTLLLQCCYPLRTHLMLLYYSLVTSLLLWRYSSRHFFVLLIQPCTQSTRSRCGLTEEQCCYVELHNLLQSQAEEAV